MKDKKIKAKEGYALKATYSGYLLHTKAVGDISCKCGASVMHGDGLETCLESQLCKKCLKHTDAWEYVESEEESKPFSGQCGTCGKTIPNCECYRLPDSGALLIGCMSAVGSEILRQPAEKGMNKSEQPKARIETQTQSEAHEKYVEGLRLRKEAEKQKATIKDLELQLGLINGD